MRNVALISFVLLSTFRAALAQPPSALTDAMLLLRDAPRVALRNLRVVDGTGAPARPNQTLMIESGRILAVGSPDDITIPEGAKDPEWAAPQTRVSGTDLASRSSFIDRAGPPPRRFATLRRGTCHPSHTRGIRPVHRRGRS
jgi:hypothetical protein